MREVKAPSRPDLERRVFLAGSIEMGQAEPWQERIVEVLSASIRSRGGAGLAPFRETPRRLVP